MPRLSVIVTSYNIADLLPRCLDTVVNQTFTDMEILVVDDGSTDGTQDVIRAYAERDDRIRPVLLPENTPGGVASAANAGLDAATGDYIGFADGDDYLERDMFAKLVDAAEANSAELAMCRYMLFVGDTGEQQEPAEQARWLDYPARTRVDLSDIENLRKLLGFVAVPWRKLYARRLIEENRIRFPVVDYFWEDNPFHWFTLCTANAVALVPDVLCHHRVGRPGQTMSTNHGGLLKIFGHYRTIADWLEQRGRLAELQPTLLSWAISQYDWIYKQLPPDEGNTLFDILSDIIAPLDAATLDRALQTKSFATRKAMRFVQAGDRQGFLDQLGLQTALSDGSLGPLRTRFEEGRALFLLGRENLARNGVRDTMSKAFLRFGLTPPKLGKRLKRPEPGISEERMLAYLAILQRDLERKHETQMERLEEIEKEIRDLKSSLDPRDGNG